MWTPGKFTGSHVPLRKMPSLFDNADSDRETDSGHASTVCGDFDETSDSLSLSEMRSESAFDDFRNTTDSAYEFDHMMKFYCHELEPEDPITDREQTKKIETIFSRQGSTRGVRGRVRAAIATFKENGVRARHKNFLVAEQGRVVLYTTSLAICRGPFFKCLEVRKILQNLMIKFSDCDLYVNRDYQTDLRERIGIEKADKVPHLFVEGQYIGDFDTILNLSENGHLRTILKPYKRSGMVPPCEQCGGFTMIPCTMCYGSKKSTHRNAWTDQFYALRCSTCDVNGLQLCPLCTGGTTSTKL